MNKHKYCGMCVTIALLVAFSNQSFGETSLNQLGKDLQGADHRAKSSAINNLAVIARENSDARQLLINQLRKEITAERVRIKKGLPREGKGEVAGETFARLLAAVADLQDPNTIEILVDSLDTGTYVKNVGDAFVVFGDSAAEMLINRIDAAGFSDLSRSEVLNTLGEIFEKGRLGNNKRESFRKKLHVTIRASDDFLRGKAVRLLGQVGDTEDLAMLHEIATKDPYCRMIDAAYRGGKKGEKIEICPVREEARRAASKLRINLNERERKRKGARE